MSSHREAFVSKVFLIVLLVSAVLFIILVWPYLSSVFLALVIASATSPIYSRLKNLPGVREGVASLTVCVIVFLLLVVPVGSFVGTLSNEAFEFYNRTMDSVSIKKIQDYLQGDSLWAIRIKKASRLSGIELDTDAIENIAISLGKNVGLYISGQLSSMATNLLSFLVNFFLMMLLIYYLLRDGVRLKAYLSGLLPFPANQQELVMDKFRETGRAILIGNAFSCVLQGLFGGIGFYVFGLGSPFLWGTIISLAAFLPIIGAGIVFVPATAILLIQEKQGMALFYLAYNLCYTALIEYVLKPRLISKGIHMNPILVFIGILGGMNLFGIMGLLYGPLIMTIFFTLAEIYRMEYKEKGRKDEEEI